MSPLIILLLIPISALAAWFLIETSDDGYVLALVFYGSPVIMIATIILKALGVI